MKRMNPDKNMHQSLSELVEHEVLKPLVSQCSLPDKLEFLHRCNARNGRYALYYTHNKSGLHFSHLKN